MKVGKYLNEATNFKLHMRQLQKLLPKIEYLKIVNAGSYVKGEIKTKDGTFMNPMGKNLDKFLEEVVNKLKDY